MKKYINGYDKFQIRTVLGRAEDVYNFSFKYQALTEYYEKVSTTDIFNDGSREKLVHFINYEWRLFYNEGIEGEDLLKFGEIEDCESQGGRIFLTPHIDYPWREFDVLILDEKRTIELMPHGRGRNSTLNKGYEISFVNRNTIKSPQMVDPNKLPVMAVRGCREF